MITEKLFEEISKMSKSEWEKVKTNIDFLYNIKAKEQDKNLFFSDDEILDSLKQCPYPIRLQFE